MLENYLHRNGHRHISKGRALWHYRIKMRAASGGRYVEQILKKDLLKRYVNVIERVEACKECREIYEGVNADKIK